MTSRPLHVALLSLSYCRDETELEHTYATQGLHVLRAHALGSPVVRERCTIDVFRANFKEKARLASGQEPSPRDPRIPPPGTDVLGLTCEPWSLTFVEALIDQARARVPGLRVWIGGDFAGFLVQRGRVRLTPRDLVFTGGPGYDEEAFRRALELLATRGAVDAEAAASLGGVVRFADDGTASTAPLQAYLLLRDRPLYFDDPDFPLNPLYDLFNVKVSQGCTMRCPFCTTAACRGERDQRVDLASPEQVTRCLDKAHDTGSRKIVIDASYVNLDTKRMVDLLRRVDDGSFDYVRCFLLLERFDDEQVAFLASLTPGRFEFEIGIQSLNPAVCRAIRRRCFRVEDVARWLAPLAVRQKVSVDYIYPLPGETPAEVRANVLALLAIPKLEVRLNQLLLGPGTEFGAAPEAWGLTVEEVDGYPFVVASEHFDRADVEAMNTWIFETLRTVGARLYPTTSRNWVEHCLSERPPFAGSSGSSSPEVPAAPTAGPFDLPTMEVVLRGLGQVTDTWHDYAYRVYPDHIELSAASGAAGHVILHPCDETTRCYLRAGSVGLSYGGPRLTDELDRIMTSLQAYVESERPD